MIVLNHHTSKVCVGSGIELVAAVKLPNGTTPGETTLTEKQFELTKASARKLFAAGVLTVKGAEAVQVVLVEPAPVETQAEEAPAPATEPAPQPEQPAPKPQHTGRRR